MSGSGGSVIPGSRRRIDRRDVLILAARRLEFNARRGKSGAGNRERFRDRRLQGVPDCLPEPCTYRAGMNAPDHDARETFPVLSAHTAFFHLFLGRIAGVPVSRDKAEVLEAIRPWHEQAVDDSGFDRADYFTAEQVHGAEIAAVGPASLRWIPGVDGLMTATPGLLLGIHVADCAPVYIVDPVGKAVALLHSGRRGTEAGITGRAVAAMGAAWGSKPEDLIVQIGPCIRPPLFEIDIPAMIRDDATAAGVPAGSIHDCGRCTGSDTKRYYSYRVGKGCTGRMLALLGLRR